MKKLLKTDPVLKILRPKLISPLDKPIWIPSPVTGNLGTIYLIVPMMNDTGFCPNAFEGDDLMGCSLKQLKNAISKFVEAIVLLVDKTSAPRDRKRCIFGFISGKPSRSHHYASADSEIESDGSISIRRMSLIPSGWGSFYRTKSAKSGSTIVENRPRSTPN